MGTNSSENVLSAPAIHFTANVTELLEFEMTYLAQQVQLAKIIGRIFQTFATVSPDLREQLETIQTFVELRDLSRITRADVPNAAGASKVERHGDDGGNLGTFELR